MTTTRPLHADFVAIVGMGLLGGSLGRALRDRCGHLVGIVEPGDDATVREALALGACHEPATIDALQAADIVIFATPVRETIRMLRELGQTLRPGTLVMDVGGSKAAIIEAMRECLPDGVGGVGGHPMCGGTETGIAASDPELFRGARWALCPVDFGDELSLQRANELVQAVGADPIVCEAAEHDRAVALVSHLPRLVATELAALLDERDGDDTALARALAGRGWAGATRLAAGDDTMWDDVLATNAAEVAAAASALAARLTRP